MNGLITDKFYNWAKAYGQSKLSNVIFAHEFNKRHEQGGVKAVSLHPVVVVSEFSRNVIKKFWMKAILYMLYPLLLYFAKATRKGAQTSTYCTLEGHQKLEGGKYYANCKIRKMKNPVSSC